MDVAGEESMRMQLRSDHTMAREVVDESRGDLTVCSTGDTSVTSGHDTGSWVEVRPMIGDERL